MRVALVSDTHGHLVALDTVLAEIAREGVDLTVCLGDIAFSGPRPGGCVESVRALGGPVVMGNCDQAAVDYYRGQGVPAAHEDSYTRLGAWVREIDVWSSLALSDDEAAWLAALPLTARVALGPGATLLLAHASPSSYSVGLRPEMTDDALRAALGGVEREDGLVALVCGHTHQPMVRDLGGFTIINPGSVGLPMARDAEGRNFNPADYAEYAILTWADNKLSVDLRRAPVDADAARAEAAASGMPRLDRWRTDMRRD
jgi:predicted phosphodiesterase